MKQLARPTTWLQRKMLPPLRTAVLGFAVLTSSMAIPDCESIARADNRSQKNLIVDAKVGVNRRTRMNAVRALERDNNALAEVACTGEYKDSRMAAVDSMIRTPDFFKLIDVMKKTSCWDTRKKIANIFSELYQNVSDFKDQTEGQKSNMGLYPEIVAMTSSFSKNKKAKRAIYVTVKKMDIILPGTEDKYLTYMAIYSPSRRTRMKIVAGFKKKEDTKALKKIAEESEYPDTRKAASLALFGIKFRIIPEKDRANDISRFSECRNHGPTTN
jgi:hypothetical protein